MMRQWTSLVVVLAMLTGAEAAAETPVIPPQPLDADWIANHCDNRNWGNVDSCRFFILGVMQADEPTRPYRIATLYCGHATVTAIVNRMNEIRTAGKLPKRRTDAASFVRDVARNLCRKPPQ